MQAKKSLGQNFLRDKGILKKIADFAQITENDTVIEVGPGKGTLTTLLLERADKVVAIEKDEELVEELKLNFNEHIANGKLEVITGDILNYESGIKNYMLVGNIPYYITGALFKKFLQQTENQPRSMTLVVQKEVAERIAGPHFGKASADKESILSISIKAYGMPEYGGTIKAGSFNPRPKVDSAIIAVRNINKESFRDEKVLEEKFFQILKKGFSHKRKLLVKNLGGVSKSIFDTCSIPEKARAEKLTVEQWICLSKNLL